jgi:hypothetical protein
MNVVSALPTRATGAVTLTLADLTPPPEMFIAPIIIKELLGTK